MFKLAQKREIDWPVTVNVPQDGGNTVKATFTARFEVLDQAEMEKVVLDGGDLWKRVLVDWKGVADEDGTEIAYSDEAKEKLVKIVYVRNALSAAYGELQSGRAAARKN